MEGGDGGWDSSDWQNVAATGGDIPMCTPGRERDLWVSIEMLHQINALSII